MTPTMAPMSPISSRILDFLVFDPSADDVARALALDFGLKYQVTKVAISLNVTDGAIFCLGDYGHTPSHSQTVISCASTFAQETDSAAIALQTEFFGWNPDQTAVIANMKVRFATVGSIIIHFAAPLSPIQLIEVEHMMSELIKPLTIFFFDRAPGANTVASASRDVTRITPQAFTSRQKKILGRLAEGHTNAGIAAELGFSVSTIRHETMKIYDKLAVSDRREAGVKAIALGLISA
jgi:DNA-binding CsgD family transcriptional regulator